MNCTDILNVFTASSMKTSPYNSFSSLPRIFPHRKAKFRSCSKVLSRKSNIKIKIKWKNPYFCVLTSLYSEEQRLQSMPAASCKWEESLQSYKSAGIWLKGSCTGTAKEYVGLFVLYKHESIWHTEFSSVSVTKKYILGHKQIFFFP